MVSNRHANVERGSFSPAAARWSSAPEALDTAFYNLSVQEELYSVQSPPPVLPQGSMEGLRTSVYSQSPAFAVHNRFIYNREERDAIVNPGLEELLRKAKDLYEQGNCDIIVFAYCPDSNDTREYFSAGILNDDSARVSCGTIPKNFRDIAESRRNIFLEKNVLRAQMRQAFTAADHFQHHLVGNRSASPARGSTAAVFSASNTPGPSGVLAASGFPSDITEYLVRIGVGKVQRQGLELTWYQTKEEAEHGFFIEEVLSEMKISLETKSHIELKLLRSLQSHVNLYTPSIQTDN
ncbi:hypothetical protein BOTBODRAFT_179920 [Botryobasidium botryosum FD-172 SS1]|uniref:Uncharacterized protein n=1 Tax=Botryobasidium botryosum (strain FD-172 SS1) TaxID=930990 RepID=A0A067M9A3_BOTB1|nr:hypothetical protein BOTBODRAFT_179920 [Botryobasidium botryosum FD-172 SS1]